MYIESVGRNLQWIYARATISIHNIIIENLNIVQGGKVCI